MPGIRFSELAASTAREVASSTPLATRLPGFLFSEGAKIVRPVARRPRSIRAAFDNRYMFRTGGGGNTGGNFTFSNSFTRKDDDGFVPSNNLGLGWAAFILGIPNSGYSVATNDTYATRSCRTVGASRRS